MSKNILKLSAIGFLLGMAINVFALLIGGSLPSAFETSGGAERFALHLIISGFYGAFCMGSTVVYDIERFPLLLSTVLHFVCVMGLYVPISLYLGWVDGISTLLIIMGIMAAVYFFIWLIMYLRYKSEVEKLNRFKEEYDAEKKEK